MDRLNTALTHHFGAHPHTRRSATPMELEFQRVHGAELLDPAAKGSPLTSAAQHTPVYTLGRRTEPSHMPLNASDLAARTGAEVVRTDRAGSVTYHAPGQLTAYMLLNLQAWQLSLHRHLELLEEAALLTLKHYGVTGHREPGMTGVWVKNESGTSAKICAIGVSARRWVTYHGLSLNVDLELAPFDEIVPCGLFGRGVTSLSRETGRDLDISDVDAVLSRSFAGGVWRDGGSGDGVSSKVVESS